jgi:hypothetical protein
MKAPRVLTFTLRFGDFTMARKALVGLSVMAVAVTVFFVGGQPAGAKGPAVNATDGTVVCSSIRGTVKFSPPLTTNEKAGTTTSTFRGTLEECSATVPSSPPVIVHSAQSLVEFRSPHGPGFDGCDIPAARAADVGRAAGATSGAGTLTIKWRSTPKLSSGPSIVNVSSTETSVASDGNLLVQFPGPGGTSGGATGSFSGTNSGASDTLAAQSDLSASTIEADCSSKGGLKSLGVTSPPSSPAASLG